MTDTAHRHAPRAAWARGLRGALALVILAGASTALMLPRARAQPAGPAQAPGSAPQVGLGQPLSAAELAPYDITVFPSGRGLPRGQGSVPRGQTLYAAQCAGCHGAKGREGPAARLVGSDGFIGWDDPLRPLRVVKHPLLVQSVGARWPYATTVFDYIRRAMPYHAPKSLGNDAVYSLTAFVLYRNGLVDAQAVLDDQSLPRVVMPGAAKTVMGEDGK